MIRTTPFHERLVEFNDQHLFTHWQGTLSPLRYTHAPKHEYFAVRHSVGVFDTSPLYKTAIVGPDAERLLARVLVRDVGALAPGRGAYTLWCDDHGFVMQDGVLLRRTAHDWLLTSARPVLAWLTQHADGLSVEVTDVTDELGVLAVQGPRSAMALRAVDGLSPLVDRLRFFDHATARVHGIPITLSRSGFTGDLGYEVLVPADADQAVVVLDAILQAGQGHGIRPFGEQALDMLRIEAGLPLVDVEWHDASTAWTDHDRVTPTEMGMGWMLRGVTTGRSFVGSAAIRQEMEQGSSRWATTGIVVDPQAWAELHREAGELPVKDERPLGFETWLRDEHGEQIGYATSFMYSPVLQRHIGIARVRPHLSAAGTRLQAETTMHHTTVLVTAQTATLPLFNPERKTAQP